MTQVPPVLRKTSMVVVVDYDPAWPDRFEQLRARIWPAVADVALGIEHVGSTAVPGLAAKPIIDMTVVVPSRPDVTVTIDRLATLGYRHRGNLGIEDREAFDHAEGLAARGETPASHRGRRCARMARRDEREYREYLNEEQRSQPGCSAGRMQLEFHHGLLGEWGQTIPSVVDGE